MLHRFEKLTKTLLPSSESPQPENSNPFENGPLNEDALYSLAYSYGLEKGNPLDTLHAIEQTALADKARELGALQDIARVFGPVLNRADAAEIEETIRDYTFRLIASKVSIHDVASLQLGNKYIDDAGTAEDINFQEFLKIAQSWDYTDKDPRIIEAVALLAREFDEHTVHHTLTAFDIAVKNDTTFAQANLDIQAQLNEMPVREAEKMIAKLAFDGCNVPIEKYNWLFASDPTRHPRIREEIS